MNTDTNTDVHVNKEPKAVIKSDSSVIVEEINLMEQSQRMKMVKSKLMNGTLEMEKI